MTQGQPWTEPVHSHLGGHRQEPVALLTPSRDWFPGGCWNNAPENKVPSKLRIEEWLQITFPGLRRIKFLPCTDPTHRPPLLDLTWPVGLTNVPSKSQPPCFLSSLYTPPRQGWRDKVGGKSRESCDKHSALRDSQHTRSPSVTGHRCSYHLRLWLWIWKSRKLCFATWSINLIFQKGRFF